MNTPEFLRPGFTMKANVWCTREGCINRHELELVKHEDNHIRYWKTCLDCQIRYAKLTKLGVPCADPRIPEVVSTTEWVFLCLHPEDIIA